MREHVGREAIDFRALDDEARHRAVERLMTQVADIVPVLPVSLAATVFIRSGGAPMSELELKAAACRLIDKLEAAGAHVYVPRANLDYAIGVGLRMLTLRRLVEQRQGLYCACPGESAVLEYYANAIAPLVARAEAR